MISAHAGTIEVTGTSISIRRTGLSAALRGDDVEASDSANGSVSTVALSRVTGTEIQEPTALDVGWVDLLGADERIVFAPNQADAARALVSDVAAALRGEVPAADGVTGLDFVALDVETANGRFGSICRVGAVRFIDGRATDERSWLCRPPQGLDEFLDANVASHGITAEDVADRPRFGEIAGEIADFIGALPLVAHNAQFDVTALRDAARASGVKGPKLLFGCSLALARHADLGLADHRLPTLAAGLGVEPTAHDEALSNAHAAGDVLVALARRAGHRGALMELFHAAGFTLGELADHRVTPVLVDRTGAGRQLQAQGVTSPAPQAALRGQEDKATGAGTDLRGAGGTPAAEPSQDSGQGKRAPWQAVATPDEIPEPSAAASPDDPLNGQNITLTGDFEPFDKGALWTAIAEHGGQVAKNVTKKTTILVTGTWASKTSKEKRAEELIAKGQEISIWPAERLYLALGLDEQPPF